MGLRRVHKLHAAKRLHADGIDQRAARILQLENDIGIVVQIGGHRRVIHIRHRAAADDEIAAGSNRAARNRIHDSLDARIQIPQTERPTREVDGRGTGVVELDELPRVGRNVRRFKILLIFHELVDDDLAEAWGGRE